MRLRMHGHYDKIREHAYVKGEEFIECYDDSAVQDCDTYAEKSIALMIEPRSIMPWGYDFLENGGYKRFKYVFTHDSKLLRTLPNAKKIIVASVWTRSDVPKTKDISLVCSFKEMCKLHKVRKTIADLYKDAPFVDVYGDWQSKVQTKWVEPEEYLRDYRYSIVIENYIDDEYFTEKILNCFANKVVPIYLGARDIGKWFNRRGIIQVDDWRDLANIEFKYFYPRTFKTYYDGIKEYIDENYEMSQYFSTFENWFFNEYGGLLDEM